MKKKIIFIGGSNRSGTTILNLIVANDVKAMALGEIINLFKPVYKNQVIVSKHMNKDLVWGPILRGGEKKLYQNLKKTFPDIDIFVDSSKDPSWISRHNNYNVDYFDIKNILIYKHPLELKKSFLKRNPKAKWERIILNYYRRYLCIIKDYKTISLSSLLKEAKTLENLCNYLEIPFSSKKYEYWNRTHPNFLGSPTIEKNIIDTSNILDFYNLNDLEKIELSLNAKLTELYTNLINKNIDLEFDSSPRYSFWLYFYLSVRNWISYKMALYTNIMKGYHK